MQKPARPNEVVLDVQAVAKSYPGPPQVHALSPISFALRRGGHVAVMGRSGSGKSTLLNLIGLIDRPSGGRVVVDGMDASALKDRALASLRAGRIGFVFQAFHLLAYRTALENVAMGMLYTGMPPRRRLLVAREALSRVGLAAKADVSPAVLSGGERQRVAIARSVAVQPLLLLCDEPTGNLDSQSAETVLTLLEDLRRGGVALVTVTHDPSVASRAERVIRLADGRVVDDTGPVAAASGSDGSTDGHRLSGGVPS